MLSRSLLATAAASGLVLTPLGWLPSAEAAPAGPGVVSVDVGDLYSGDDLSGIQVTLYSTATGAAVASRTTPVDDPSTSEQDESSGVVSFEGVDLGTYTAKAHDPSGKHQDRYSTAVVLTDGDAYENISIRMTPIGASFGRLGGDVSQVTDNDLSAYVEVYPSTVTTAAIESGEADYVSRTYVGDYVEDDGVQTLSDDWQLNLAPGSYKVRAVDIDSQTCGYVEGEYECSYSRTTWVGGNTAETATALTVVAGKNNTTADVTLPAEAVTGVKRITGTVTGPGGIKIDDVEVDLLQRLDNQWIEVASTETGADGTYGFSHARECQVETYEYNENTYTDIDCGDDAPVRAGTFTLRFSDDRSDGYYASPKEFETVYFGNVAPASEGQPPENAQTVTLGETGTQTAAASMTRLPLDTSTGLYGRLSDDAGAGRAGDVRIYDLSGRYVSRANTRRDGSWAVPVTELAPGSYKLAAQGDELVESWVGGKTFAAAKTYTVPVKGSTNAGASVLARYARLSGKVSVTGIAGVDSSDTGVTIWDANGRQVDGAETERDGSFSLSLKPGTYLVSADGEAFDSFDQSNAEIGDRPLIERFWTSAWSVATATRVKVVSGARLTGFNFALSNQLVATGKPRVTGKAQLRKVLTASAGSWNVSEDVTYKYVWKRGTKVVSSKAGYKVAKADLGKTLTVTVTATDATGTYRAGSTAASVKVPKPRKKK
jgi:hypothetical protein